uniref:Serpin B6 n=1 Tax=Chelonoidis abingdonii TaxID=106734 RepID=A0A8C0G4Y5_CHEAB
MDNLSKSNITFALNLFKKLSENGNAQNLFFSPLSISSALSMVFLGAKGNTAAQMAKVCLDKLEPLNTSLVLALDKAEEIHNGYQSLISEINKPGTNYVLRIANRLYGEKTFKFLATFIDSCQKFYHAELQQLDFSRAAEDSRKHINAWVEEKTEGKIQNLLAQGVVDSMTRLVLVNAIYFKGNWATQFNKDYRQSMMSKEAKYNMSYLTDFQTKILDLPYVDNETSMIILLPDEIQDNSTGLEQVSHLELTHEKLTEWIHPEMMDYSEVEVFLPRFKLEQAYDLKPVLESMGMADAFDSDKVDLSGMSASNDLVLSEVVHKSFVEVNEEGTEAAAATGVILAGCCLQIPPQFTADHPFLFFIRHNKTGNILFYGRFCSP